MLNIDRDLGRFRDIVKGRVRKDLRKYMSSGELIGRQGNKTVSVPIHSIGIPRLRYGENKQGIGQGDGDDGDQPGRGPEARRQRRRAHARDRIHGRRARRHPRRGTGAPRASSRRGTRRARSIQVEVQGHLAPSVRSRCGTSSAPTGRRCSARSRRERSIPRGRSSSRSRRTSATAPCVEEKEPRSAAVIVYMMDVSGSMGKEQKEIVRSEAFWIDTWLRHNYDDVETRFIIHDAAAREVDRETVLPHPRVGRHADLQRVQALRSRSSRTTTRPTEWNIYPFHFSDGDNWSQSDTAHCACRPAEAEG